MFVVSADADIRTERSKVPSDATPLRADTRYPSVADYEPRPHERSQVRNVGLGARKKLASNVCFTVRLQNGNYWKQRRPSESSIMQLYK